jgi:hypothetical protein
MSTTSSRLRRRTSSSLPVCSLTSCFRVSGFLFEVSERHQRQDLNGDGDRWDVVLHVRDLEAGETTNLGLAGFVRALSDEWFVFGVSERSQGADLNGDGDGEDFSVLHVLDLNTLSTLPRFLRGDCNADALVEGSVADALFYLEWAFSDGPEPECLTACDADGDGFVGGSVTDPLYYLNWAFLGTSAPPSPFPQCGKSLREEDFPMRCDAPAECR